jgi:L-rhamnose mutarotase
MSRVGFKMQLLKGNEEEYKKRHDAIWPELQELLEKSGISNYVIYLDEPTGVLFASMNVTDDNTTAENPHHPVMKKWWDFMGDIMVTNPDHSPVATPLKEVFFLP